MVTAAFVNRVQVVRRALALWAAATLLYFLGAWSLQARIFDAYWERVGGMFALTVVYALVGLFLGRWVLYEVSSLNVALRRAQEAEQEHLQVRTHLESVRTIAREACHQANNTLAEAIGNLDLLIYQHPLTERERQLAEHAIAAMERTSHHIARIQQVARLDPVQPPATSALEPGWLGEASG